jgi:lipoate-protein ligase B
MNSTSFSIHENNTLARPRRVLCSSQGTLSWFCLGEKRGFRPILNLQKKIREGFLGPRPIYFKDNVLIFTCTHEPTLSFGYRSDPNGQSDHPDYRGLRRSPDKVKKWGVMLEKSERGGGATYHGPGQLMVYALLHLPTWKLGVRRYIGLLEKMASEVLVDFGLPQVLRGEQTRSKEPGVWLGQANDNGSLRKIAAIGVHIRQGVPIQGLCLNVCGDLTPYSWIVACDHPGLQVTNMEKERLAVGAAGNTPWGFPLESGVLAKALVEHFWNLLNSNKLE